MGGEASEPHRRKQQQGCRRQGREIPNTEDHCRPGLTSLISLSPHPPTGQRGAEALALEVRSQGEDWGWLYKNSMKRASKQQLTRGNPGKSLELPESQKTIFLGVGEENVFRAQLKQASKMAMSHGYQSRHQRRTWNSNTAAAPRTLCASTDHYLHVPPRRLYNRPLPGSCDTGTTSLGRHMARLRLLQCHAGLCRCHRL